MGRRIDTDYPAAGMLAAKAKPKDDVDRYLERLTKYIPAEVLAAYSTCAGLVPASETLTVQRGALWFLFGLFWILTPVYLWYATTTPVFAFRAANRQKPPQKLVVVLGSIAFPVWVMMTGGVFATYPDFVAHRWVVSILMVIVSFGFAFFRPARGS